ncbi:MAG: hypothetical protein U5L45_04870 [Saprospiraceae bacterium]|nr:hypothetical protein [Saprospiraceae bacterium]
MTDFTDLYDYGFTDFKLRIYEFYEFYGFIRLRILSYGFTDYTDYYDCCMKNEIKRILKPYINSKYALKGIFALASLAQKKEKVVHFSGKARKMNHIPPSRERSERENQQFRFYVWFQKEDSSKTRNGLKLY